MFSRRADSLLALSWVPFAVAGHVVEQQPSELRALFAVVMFVSFSHQPVTFPLVYASPWRLAGHRRLFLWAPAVAVAVIVVATQVSLTLVAVVGGLWNAEHILMQRYGITRVYGRKAGDEQGPVERWMLVCWFAVPLLWCAASGRLTRVLDRMSSGSVDADAARILASMRAGARVGLVLAAVGALGLTAWWAAQLRRRVGANPGKWLYLGSTAGMFALAVVDPVAAVVGFVASHSVEYFVLVGRSVGAEAGQPGALGRWARRRHGRIEFFAGYGLAVAAVFVGLYRVAPAGVLLVAALTIGALHFFYDAFIWKLRKPAVAASLVRPGP
jgi:hypothetical protein